MSAFVVLQACLLATALGLPAPDLPEAGAQTTIEAPFEASKPEIESTCIADCGEYSDVSCSGVGCSALNRNCNAGQRGYVVCDGSYTYCPPCPPAPECSSGDSKYVPTGFCCGPMARYEAYYRCVNGQWDYVKTYCVQLSAYCSNPDPP